MNDDAVELRYSREDKLKDVIYAAAAGMVLGSLALFMLKPRIDTVGIAHVLAAWTGASVPFVLVAGLWRWGRRGRMDHEGASLLLSDNGPCLRIAWEEVEEIFQIGGEGVELRGRGVRLRFPAHLAGLRPAWGLIGRRRGAALGTELQRRLDSGETLRFNGVDSPGVGMLLAGGALAVFLPAIFALAALLLPAFSGGRSWGDGCGELVATFCLVWLVAFLWALLVAISWRFGSVELGPEGLLVRKPPLVRRCRWDEVRALEVDSRSQLVIRTHQDAPIRLPPGLSNGMFLEDLIRRRLEAREGR